MRLLVPALSAAVVLAVASPALALAPSGRHDNIVYLNRLKMEREARAERAAREPAATRLAQARRQATATVRAEAPAEPAAQPRTAGEH